jgi:putative MATE family efflux protein
MAFLDATDRRLLRLAGPAFLTLSAEPIYVLVDTAIVGHVGTTQLGGLAIAGTILSTVTWLIGFLATGVTTQVAQRRGAGDEVGARGAVSQGLNLAIFLGVTIALVVTVAARPLAKLVGAKTQLLEAAIEYLQIAALGVPAIALTLLALGWYRGTENLRLPVKVAIAANVANILLEMLFVWVFHWGLKGSAASTTLVQWVVVVAYFLSLRGVIQIRRPQFKALRALLEIGGAMLIRTGLMVSTLSAATWFVAKEGEQSLGAHQIGVQIYFFFALMVDALAVSSQSVFANEFGRSANGEYNGRLWPTVRRLMRLGFIAGVALALVLVVTSPVLGRLFSDDATVLHRSVGVLLWCALMQVTGAVVFVLDGVLMGASLFRSLAVGASASALSFWLVAGLTERGFSNVAGLANLRGLTGVWIALNVWMAVRLFGNWRIAVRHLRR